MVAGGPPDPSRPRSLRQPSSQPLPVEHGRGVAAGSGGDLGLGAGARKSAALLWFVRILELSLCHHSREMC